MELPKSDISFQNGKVMLRRGLIVNASDTSPEGIYDLVTENAVHIYTQMYDLMESVDPHTEKRRDVLRPAILVARLALLHARNEVFTQRGLESPSHIHTAVDDLTHEYTPYWRYIATSGFHPEVQEINTSADTSGIWLGVRADPSNNSHILKKHL